MRMFSDETITGRFPVGTNDPKHIKPVSAVPCRTIQSLLIEFLHNLYNHYSTLNNQLTNYKSNSIR